MTDSYAGASRPTTSMPSARPRIGSCPRSRTANGGAELNRPIARRDATKRPPPPTLRPGHDPLVADIVEHFAARVHHRDGEQAEGAIEETVDPDSAEPLGQP